MADQKELVASALARAQAGLSDALSELEKMPAFDPGSTAFAAHALNNYLSVTQGTVELVLLHLTDYPDPQVRVWLEGAQHATNLMARLVGQLMGTPSPAGAPVRLEGFDLRALARRACNYYQRLVDRKGIRVDPGPAGGAQPVWADRVLVAAVLDNLLSNAVKYSAPGGRVRVEVRGEGGWAVCGVRDDGPGLGPEDQARLFQRGARLTPRPTGGEPSTGYGLAVAKELVERLGGAIWCQSTPGHGATFSFRLPAHQPTPGGAGPGT